MTVDDDRSHIVEYTVIMIPAQDNLLTELVRAGLLDQQLAEQIKIELARGGRTVEELVKEKGVTDEQLVKVKAEMMGVPSFDERMVSMNPEALNLVPRALAERMLIFPITFDRQRNEMGVAMVDPNDVKTIEFLTTKVGMKIKPYMATNRQVEDLINEKYSQGLSGDISDVLRGSKENINKAKGGVSVVSSDEQVIKQPTVVQVVTRILEHAVRSRASDIHIEPQENRIRVRYRIDGILQERLELPKDLHAAVISRIKILSGMKIDEKRIPQDGRFTFSLDDRDIDLRISSLPTIHGEKIVMRLLDKSSNVPSLQDLGLRGVALKNLEMAIAVPHGIVLITGPTGSGKTTTLYSLLTKINTSKVNIVTLEDPVEYQMPGVNQVQVNPQAGLTFASGLRSFLRQDPNIIMVGEIRDEETADLAIQASLTGHLVFSTVHTNSAAGALPRLIDMKAEPFLLASSITAIVGQRVVGKICPTCRESYVPEPAVVQDIKNTLGSMYDSWVNANQEKNMPAQKNGAEFLLYRGKGCEECDNVGYLGRIGIYEVLMVNEKIGKLIMERSDADNIEKTAVSDGMVLMKQDGYLKVLEGISTIEEVLRVAQI